MGILNVTPDSFYDGGKFQNLSNAIDHVAAMLEAGATIIDIGGESTRPGAQRVSDEEEAARVVPVVVAVAERFDTFISVDTSKALVIREIAAAGAHLINDIRSLSEPGALSAAAGSKLPVCLMHMQGKPSTMQKAPYYKNVLIDVMTFLEQQIARCEAAGITKDRLLFDPGFGFGKTLSHNYKLLAQLGKLHDLGLPMLVGMSRKLMIGELLDLPSEKRISGSLACAIIAALQGAHIIRVHDVKKTSEAMRVVEATLKAKETYFQ